MIAEFFAPLAIRIAASVIVALVAAGCWVGIVEHYEHKGYAKAIAAVAARDKEAINGVSKAKTQVDACDAAGRSWNVTDGVCE